MVSLLTLGVFEVEVDLWVVGEEGLEGVLVSLPTDLSQLQLQGVQWGQLQLGCVTLL